MNLEEFKVSTKEQRIEYGKTIPLGDRYNSNNNQLTYKDSDGFWVEYTYDSNCNQLSLKDSKGFWSEYTYDFNNNLLIRNASDGFWVECTYDSNCNQLSLKDSTGFWSEHTYDSNGNALTYKNSYGVNRIFLTKGKVHTLWYDIDGKKYKAGCQELSYKRCLDYYNEYKDDHTDAELFLNTIKEHYKTVKEL